MFIQLNFLCVLIFQVLANPFPGFGLNKDLHEGDIKLSAQQENLLSGIEGRTGLLELFRRWPKSLNGFVEIPYKLDPSYTQWHVDWMLDQFSKIEAITCVRFVPRTYQIDWLDIIADGGCWSWIGRMGGRQEVAMSPGCFYHGVGAHEMVHALGFGHMHNASDRDEYLDIRWENISPEDQRSLDIYDTNWTSNFNTPYDILSAMNYDRTAWSINGKDTLVPRDLKYLDIVGRSQFSAGDGTRVNRMYLCSKP